jgi:hypothetical protein
MPQAAAETAPLRRRLACGSCGKDLPAEESRDDLTCGTDVCLRCASIRLNEAYKSPAGRRWLETWKEKLRTAMQLREPNL